MKYKTVIGLEIHTELLTETKIFCSCKNSFGGEANERVCPVCAGLPGSLPSLNKEAVRLAVLAGAALDCKINTYSSFDRKNYFYPDLPKAYQITQFENPICSEGAVKIGDREYRVERIHLEEDAGKLIHENGTTKADFNRCGVPLIEIVTMPDFESAEQVCDFVREIAHRLKYAGVCDARLEQGSIRADVNISIMPCGAKEYGTRTEIKNLNSYKAIKRAIEYEGKRQASVLEAGGTIVRETLRFDGEKTISMRSKEDAGDYRYFPEPDILPIVVSEEEIEKIKKELPEMPRARIERFINAGLSEKDAELIAENKDFCDFFDAAAKLSGNLTETAKLMLGAVSRELNASGGKIPFEPQRLAELVGMLCGGEISGGSASEIVKEMFLSGAEPRQLARECGMLLEENDEEIFGVICKITEQNPKAVEDYIGGNKKSFGFLMGAAMKLLPKSTNPKSVRDILEKTLNR